jgi:hypothetical protein
MTFYKALGKNQINPESYLWRTPFTDPTNKQLICERGCTQFYFRNKAMQTLHYRRVHDGIQRAKQRGGGARRVHILQYTEHALDGNAVLKLNLKSG